MSTRIIAGLVLLLAGLLFVVFDFYIRAFALSIWGLIFIAVGVAVAVNRNEDVIEGRKDLKNGKRKK